MLLHNNGGHHADLSLNLTLNPMLIVKVGIPVNGKIDIQNNLRGFTRILPMNTTSDMYEIRGLVRLDSHPLVPISALGIGE